MDSIGVECDMSFPQKKHAGQITSLLESAVFCASFCDFMIVMHVQL